MLGYELYPKPLVSRIKEQRKEVWDVEHKYLVFKVQIEMSNNKDKDLRAELKDRLEVLNTLQLSYDDLGIIHDWVVFFDRENWRAVIDIDESGDLIKFAPMTDYRKELQ
jgi:tripeptidyl-peptidase II